MPKSRSYSSPLRERHAFQTREAVLRAAAGLFAEHGFQATTIRAIGAAADVSTATIYAAFGSKAQLIPALLGQLEADAAPPASDLDAQAWVAYHCRIMSVSRRVIRVALQATGEPGVAALFEAGDQNRRKSLAAALPSQPRKVRDHIWAITAPTVYLALVDTCKWTDDEYRRWLDNIISQLESA